MVLRLSVYLLKLYSHITSVRGGPGACAHEVSGTRTVCRLLVNLTSTSHAAARGPMRKPPK